LRIIKKEFTTCLSNQNLTIPASLLDVTYLTIQMSFTFEMVRVINNFKCVLNSNLIKKLSINISLFLIFINIRILKFILNTINDKAKNHKVKFP